ncbi:MAG: MBL fold metallo-hydrolase [Bacilli bacterium]
MYSFIKYSDEIYYVEGNPSQPTPKIVIISGKLCSLLIDTGNEIEQIESLKEGIKKFNLPPIKYIVITHFHDDHIHNISYFKDLEIIASKYTAKYIKYKTKIIDSKTSIDLGNLLVTIDILPNSHAKGSLLVYEYKSRIMFIGDALCGKIIGQKLYLNKSSTYEMIKKISEYDVKDFIDGHSNPNDTTKDKVMETLIRYKLLCNNREDLIELKE